MIKFLTYECDTIDEFLAVIRELKKDEPEHNDDSIIQSYLAEEVPSEIFEVLMAEKGYSVKDRNSKIKYRDLFNIRVSKRRNRLWYNAKDIKNVPKRIYSRKR